MNTKVPCPAGSYCIYGKEYKCYAGYLCISGAKTPTPTDGSTGEACERGHYCEEGALEATPCPVGTYNSFEGASSLDMGKFYQISLLTLDSSSLEDIQNRMLNLQCLNSIQ